jgi:SAM-dependent methyltransferase
MPDGGWWQALWPDPGRVLAQSGLAAGMDAVDLCAGDGWFTVPIGRVARQVVAVEIDAALLERARLRFAGSALTNCRFVHGNAYDVAKLVRVPVDFVFLANAFHGVPNRPRLAQAASAILKPTGLFAIVNWHARPREATPLLGEPRGPATEQRMTPEATAASVASSGLVLHEIAEVSPYHYAAIFRKSI